MDILRVNVYIMAVVECNFNIHSIGGSHGKFFIFGGGGGDFQVCS